MQIFFAALLASIAFTDAKLLSFDKIEVDIDPYYVNVAPKIAAEGGINRINLDIDILMEESEMFYEAIVYRHNVDHYDQYYKTGMENNCNHATINDFVLSSIFKELENYGNVTEICPLKVGHYTLRSFTIDTNDLPWLDAGRYRFDLIAFVKDYFGNLHNIFTDRNYFEV